MLKLALNGVYGDSNNGFSVFYDPLFTMRITLNGQLLLCKLVEYILRRFQGAPDPVQHRWHNSQDTRKSSYALQEACDKWQFLTRLNLEQVNYKRMCIRDVNNYLGQYENGKVKRKGAYEYEMEGIRTIQPW